MKSIFRKPSPLPIEVFVVLAINAVIAVAGYYAIMIWGMAFG